jgi:putative ABC transport system permease protein
MPFALELRAAFRGLARSPGYGAAVVLSLALGIGSAASAFGVLDAVRFRALPFPDADRLVSIVESPADRPGECRTGCDVSYESFANMLRLHPPRALDALAGFTAGGKALATSTEPILLMGGVASPDLFDLLRVKPVLGRALSPDDDRLGAPLVTVLSHALWVTQFGADPEIVGKSIKLSDSHYTVVGVMPAGFDFEVGSKFWLPVVPTLDPSTRPSIRSLNVIGRLAPGRTLAQLAGELATLDPAALAQGATGTRTPMRLTASPLRDRYTGATRSHDLVFAGVVAAVLLIACANVANLALLRTLFRMRELAVRAALGAPRLRLARGPMLEHGMLVAAAAVLGVAFAARFLTLLRSLDVLRSLRPSGMEYGLDGRVAGFAVLLAAGIAVLLGVVSVHAVARADLTRLIREGSPSGAGQAAGGGRQLAQSAFVVAQVAGATALLTGAGLMTRTAFRIAELDPGFAPGPVVAGSPSYPHPWRVREKYLPVTRQILAELQQLPGADLVAIRASVPLGARNEIAAMVVEGGAAPLPRELAPSAALAVSPGYFSSLGVGMVSGRDFTEFDTEAAPAVAVINEWAARRWWPGQAAIGRTIRLDTAPSRPATITVVGVVRNNRAASGNLLLAEEGPELYRPYEQSPSAFPTFLIKARVPPARLLQPVRATLARLVPDRPVSATLMAQRVSDQVAGVRLNAIQILAFAAVGLCLSLLGIYGVLSYAVGRRTREIGIRSALGATRGGIERMVLADAARLTLAGLLLGMPAAFWGSQVIRSLLYGTDRADPMVYGAVALGTALAALAAAYLPARRAARVDPARALRAS